MKTVTHQTLCITYFSITYRPRLFDQVGHQTMYAFMGNKQFFTKQCHCQTYQNYELSRQKLGTFLENKVHTLKIKVFKISFIKVDLLVKYSLQKKKSERFG